MWIDVYRVAGFLLPILKLFEELSQKKGNIPAASAAVLVPSPHLAQQVR